MHILFGVVVGAIFAVGVTAVAAIATGQKPSAKSLLIAALGGAIAGGVCAATLGAGGLIGTSLARQAGAFAAGGAVGGAAERVTINAVDDRPLHQGVVTSTAVGGAAGLVSFGTIRGSRAILTRVAPSLVSTQPIGAKALLTAPVPGTGAGVVRAFEDRAEAKTEADTDPLDTTVSAPADNTRAPPKTSNARGLRGLLDK